jgi:hypothetical protein
VLNFRVASNWVSKETEAWNWVSIFEISPSPSSDQGTNVQLLAISVRLLLGSGDEHTSPSHRPAPPPALVASSRATTDAAPAR